MPGPNGSMLGHAGFCCTRRMPPRCVGLPSCVPSVGVRAISVSVADVGEPDGDVDFLPLEQPTRPMRGERCAAYGNAAEEPAA